MQQRCLGSKNAKLAKCAISARNQYTFCLWNCPPRYTEVSQKGGRQGHLEGIKEFLEVPIWKYAGLIFLMDPLYVSDGDPQTQLLTTWFTARTWT